MQNADGNRSSFVGYGFLPIAVLLFMLSGCGPVGYVHNVVIKAESSVARAETNDAAQYAPYEYYGAKAYLEQARLRAGFGDFQTAIRYGKKSYEMAKKAGELTAERLAEKDDVGLHENLSDTGAVDEGNKEESKILEAETDSGSGDVGEGDVELPQGLD